MPQWEQPEKLDTLKERFWAKMSEPCWRFLDSTGQVPGEKQASWVKFLSRLSRKWGSKISEKKMMEAGKESTPPSRPSLPLKDHPEVAQFTQSSGRAPQMGKPLATAISGENTHMTLPSVSPASLPLSSFPLLGMVIPNKAMAHEPLCLKLCSVLKLGSK